MTAETSIALILLFQSLALIVCLVVIRQVTQADIPSIVERLDAQGQVNEAQNEFNKVAAQAVLAIKQELKSDV